jgi:hypothetical protein
MKQLRLAVGSVVLAVSMGLCACTTAAKLSGKSHLDKANRAVEQASTLAMGAPDEPTQRRALRELKIAGRELKLAQEAFAEEWKVAMRDADEDFESMLQHTSWDAITRRRERKKHRHEMELLYQARMQAAVKSRHKFEELLRTLEQGLSRTDRVVGKAPLSGR